VGEPAEQARAGRSRNMIAIAPVTLEGTARQTPVTAAMFPGCIAGVIMVQQLLGARRMAKVTASTPPAQSKGGARKLGKGTAPCTQARREVLDLVHW